MILDKKINISINSRNLTYYKSKNYNVEVGDNIIINVSDLHNGSISKINIKCDNCDSKKCMEYRLYNNNLKKDGKYYCNKCKHIKSKLTKIELYGDQNYNNIEKYKKTCLENYGVESPLMNINIKNKAKNTRLEKYGDENYNNIEKCKKTKLELYGNEKYNNIEKYRKTCVEKYNVNSVFNLEDIRVKIYESKKNRLINLYKEYNLLDINYEKYVYICNCPKNHIFEIPKTIFYNRIKTKTTLCTICNPIGLQNSDKENLIYDFIKVNYTEEILKNKKSIISPYELDIYLPYLKLAFEFNGLYWHNELYRPNNYHLNKTELCEKKGIQLIHIYEDDWDYKQNIIKSMILNKLGKSKFRISARKCEIKEIFDNNLVKSFLESNHIQGYVDSILKIGLFYMNELVSLMTFNSKEKTYELLRFCNKLNTNVVGGVSKLFKNFINNYNPTEIITYSDRSFSQGKIYETLGFNFVSKTDPNYYYIVDGIRQLEINSNKYEHDIMLQRKIYRIYDSGNLKFKLQL